MGFFDNVLRYESSAMDNRWKKIQKNPERIFMGTMDPFSTGISNKVFGTNYEPVVDQFGGTTNDDVQKAKREGIDTKDGEGMHNVARAITAMYAGGAASGGGGAAGGASAGGAAGGASAGASSGGFMGGVKSMGQAAGAAQSVQGLLSPQQQAVQASPVTIGNGSAMGSVYAQIEQAELQRQQAEMQQRQQRRQGLLGYGG